MALVANCGGGGGRLITAGTQSAVPLSLVLTYTTGLQQAPLVFGPASVQAELTAILNQFINSQGTPGRVDLTKLGVATQLQAEQSVITQYQNALSDTIFVVPFGDAVGEVRVSFIANRKCDQNETDPVAIVQHYLDHRILPLRNRGPALIGIGSAVFRGHLQSMSLASSSQDIPMTQGTLIFKAWPL